jgi:hypothetical protein
VSQHTTTPCVLFPELFDHPVVARFDQEHGSSDGGAVLLKAADRRLGLTADLAACLTDRRQAGKVAHELEELVAQRVFAIALGYPDANDAARLADDPIHKLLVGRDPVAGDALASQPTLSRFENGCDPRALYRMGEALAERVIERHRSRLKGRAHRIFLDLDVTDDPTHGVQQLAFFNGFYDTWCYLPLLGFVSFDEEPDQFLVAALLRPGNAPTARGTLGLLRRLLPRLRRAFPRAQVLVRLDCGFASPALLDFLDAEPRTDYVLGLPTNAVLGREAASLMERAQVESEETDATAHLYGSFSYAAKSWSTERRIIVKAEVVRGAEKEPKDNPRFLVTNLPHLPQWIYERIYCRRGEIENRIKELHDGLEIDRTSCSRFFANQARVLLTAAAYVLMQEIRLKAARTGCARAQVATLRERLLKLGVRVVVSVRRVVLHLPATFPYQAAWQRVALGLGARAG